MICTTLALCTHNAIQTRSGWALPIGWKPEDDNDRIDTFHPTQLDKDHFVELMNSKIWTEDQRQKGLAWLDNINDQLTKVEWDNKISRMESQHQRSELMTFSFQKDEKNTTIYFSQSRKALRSDEDWSVDELTLEYEWRVEKMKYGIFSRSPL